MLVAHCLLLIAHRWHYFSCGTLQTRWKVSVMNKTAINSALLQLLVRVYNQSIQSYYFFPEVILCGTQRLDREAFDLLVRESFLVAYHTDSFGKLYRLSRSAEDLLRQYTQRRRHRVQRGKMRPAQIHFAFC